MKIECCKAHCTETACLSIGKHDNNAAILTLIAPTDWLVAGDESDEYGNTVTLTVLCPSHHREQLERAALVQA